MEEKKDVVEYSKNEMNLKDTMLLLYYNWTIIVGLTVIGMIVGITYAFTRVPNYYAEATIRVNGVSRYQQVYGRLGNLTIDSDLANTYELLIKNDNLLSKVKENLALDRSVKTLKKQLNIVKEDKTMLINIGIADPNPIKSSLIVNEVVSEFNKKINSLKSLGSFEIIDEAAIPVNKNPSRAKLIIVFFTLLGAVAGSAGVLLYDILQPKVREKRSN